MAELSINHSNIKGNIKWLDSFFHSRRLTWTLVLKVLGGNEEYWNLLLENIDTKALNGIADSRIEHLEQIKISRPEWTTWQIRPPSLHNADKIVEFVDVSCNSSMKTLRALNSAALKQDKKHRVILMIELGENREGFPIEEVESNFPEIINLTNIKIEGLGANLGCLYGVAPSYEKLSMLTRLHTKLENTFKIKIPLVSGGSSINLPLIQKGLVPRGINHYRIGEAVFFGTSPYDNKQFAGLFTSNFTFRATVLEVHAKTPSPNGPLIPSAIGSTLNTPEETEHGQQALLDFGLVDVDPGDLCPANPLLTIIGSTSDMTAIYDPESQLHSGDQVAFIPSYMGVAKIASSMTVRKNWLVH